MTGVQTCALPICFPVTIIGIVVVVLIFLANVYLTAIKGERTGIITVLMAGLLALARLYLAGMFYTNNISIDQYWWWWVIHLWVEATWEVFVAKARRRTGRNRPFAGRGG